MYIRDAVSQIGLAGLRGVAAAADTSPALLFFG